MVDVNVTVIGYAGSDPQLMESKSGLKWTHLRVGTTKATRDGESGQWIDGPTLWFKVKAWGGKAQNVTDSIRKGTPVVVTGRLAAEPYMVSKQGEEGETIIEHRVTLTIENPTIGVDLARGTARYARTNRDLPEPADAPDYALRENAAAHGFGTMLERNGDAGQDAIGEDGENDLDGWDRERQEVPEKELVAA